MPNAKLHAACCVNPRRCFALVDQSGTFSFSLPTGMGYR